MKDMGLPLEMKPNYEDFSCQVYFPLVLCVVTPFVFGRHSTRLGMCGRINRGHSGGGPTWEFFHILFKYPTFLVRCFFFFNRERGSAASFPCAQGSLLFFCFTPR